MIEKINKKKRNLIKFVALGGGVLALGKIFGPKFLDFLYGPAVTKDFKQFNVTENRKEFTVSTKDGEPIFVMDNEQ